MINLKNMRDKYKFKLIRRGEQKRLERIFKDFEKDYWELCKKYNAQWAPIVIPSKGRQQFILQLQLQPYYSAPEVPQEVVDRAVEKIANGKAENAEPQLSNAPAN